MFQVTVVRVGKRCFLVPTTDGLTFDAARDEVEARNGNTVTVPLPADSGLVAIGGRLTAQEVRILVRETPTIKTFCNGEIFQTTPGTIPDTIPQGQIVTSVVTLDTRFNILTTLASPKSRVYGKRRP
ncbi:uncharacterized protein [Littorina saxatilis]|uniref:uncharacterized protein n=1 Tax=Littorina saxatilis TaxID=31220 RepID=UPI0038B42A82